MRGYEMVPWTDEERQQLRRLHDNGMTQTQIGKAMGRSKNSIHRQMANMGLVRSDRNSAVVRHVTPGHAVHRAPGTTLPPLPSLSMGADGECGPDEWDGVRWPKGEDFWP
jgi:Helix-turn-helix domain